MLGKLFYLPALFSLFALPGLRWSILPTDCDLTSWKR
jgi:hypothetical protein